MDVTVTLDNRDAAFTPDPLPQRHPAAGTRAEAAPDADARLLESLHQRNVDLGQQLADALARLRDHETAEATGGCVGCVGCLGHQRVIAEMKAAARADRRELAAAKAEFVRVDRALRSYAAAVVHAQAHWEPAAEGGE